MLENAVVNSLFYVFAVATVFFAIATVTSRRILRAAVHLMTVLIMSAGFYLLLGAEFLAGVQILVYVGGIVVLLVFAIMLTRSSELLEERPSLKRKLIGVASAALFFGATVAMLKTTPFAVSSSADPMVADAAAIGRMLLDRGPEGYVVPFEVISLLLLAAAIGGIVVARKTPVQGGGKK